MRMMDKYTEDIQARIKKLPERLRMYIARLEKDVAHYRQMLTQTEEGKTSVSWTDYANEKHLPDKGVVRYKFSNGIIEVTLKDDQIEIRKSGFNTSLVIMPAYSNSFYVAIIGPGEESAAGDD